MAGKTNFLENLILDRIFRTDPGSIRPAAVYVGLFTALPGEDGTGGTEVSGGGYARQQVTQADANWSDPTAGTQGEVDNVADVDFGAATANWGTIVGVGIFDASSGGNLLYFAALTADKTVDNGDSFKFAAGELNISED